jgi:predicted Rossmann-fold nucleotide-binding protein
MFEMWTLMIGPGNMFKASRSAMDVKDQAVGLMLHLDLRGCPPE